MSQTLSEFDLIARFFDVQALTGSPDNPFIPLAIGDDCALLAPTAGCQLAVSVDTLISGVHFLPDAPADRLAWRALAVSISDLAAMGADPKAFTLALTLPEANADWLQAFAAGLARAAQHYGIVLVGGDTTRGPLAMTLQVMGEVPIGAALRRDGARAGDDIFVSGSLGAAHMALDFLSSAQGEQASEFLHAYYEPNSCIELGKALRGIASAAVDISDGLLADLGHIAARSGVAMEIESALLPIYPTVRELREPALALKAAATGGDDYQLAFCVPADRVPALLALPFNVTRIGRCRAGCGVTLDQQSVSETGYQHFEASYDHAR